MNKRWPVIDTCLTLGVSPNVHFIAEEELVPYLDLNEIDIQIVYQPDESFHHYTPQWNQFLGNDYISKIQRESPGRVIGLATIQLWHQIGSGGRGILKRDIALEEVDRAILDLDLQGLRMNPLQHNYQFNDKHLVWPILDRLVHLQEIIGERMIVSVYASGDSLNNSPEAIALTAERFPELIFLMQHTGFVWGCGTVNDTAALLQNVLLDVSTMPQKEIVYKSYERFGISKFCIGMDGPFGSRLIKEAIVRDFCKNHYEMDMMLGGNLARLIIPSERCDVDG